MTPEELLNEWTNGDSSGLRPERLQRLREEVREATGRTPPRRISELEAWQERLKSQLTKEIREAAEES